MTKKLVVSASLLAKSQVAAYTRKDGTMVQSHDNGRQAAAVKPAAGRPAPAPGDVGHEEHQKYGVHFKKGDKVKDRYGKSHEVLSHNGAEVKTASGESFHPTKLFHDAVGANKPMPEHVQKMVSDVAQSSAKPEHKRAAIDAIVAQHAGGAPSTGAKKLAVRASVAKKAATKTGSAAPAKPDWKAAHEDAESELAVAGYRGGSKQKAVAALNKAADLHRAAAKRQAPGDMTPDHHNAYADKLSAMAKDHGGY